METLAVMSGFSSSAGDSMRTITSKFTTPEMIVPFGAIRATRPSNSRVG